MCDDLVCLRFQRSEMMRDLETESVWGSSLDSLAAEDVSAGGLTVTESRGRRVSSLGDEVYYALDTDGGVGGAASKLTSINMKHQHSLESYELYKEKLLKIREKQANMSGGWEGQTQPSRAVPPRLSLHPPTAGSSLQLADSLPRLTNNQPRLNTIQMGLAAIFNPENYKQQQSKKLPFIPGHHYACISV